MVESAERLTADSGEREADVSMTLSIVKTVRIWLMVWYYVKEILYRQANNLINTQRYCSVGLISPRDPRGPTLLCSAVNYFY